MKHDDDASSTRYARAIERRWVALVDRPVVLSRRDWSQITRWHSRGVPLDLIEEALRSAVQPERGRGLRGLAQIASEVDEAWSLILQGRLSPDSVETGRPPTDPREAWQRCIGNETAGSALANALTGLLERLDQGQDPGLLDLELERRLPELAPGRLVDRVLGELQAELASYASRMSPERLRETRKRACEKRLRQALNLPRLAGAWTTE